MSSGRATFRKKIGEGGYCKVYLYVSEDGRQYAVKRLKDDVDEDGTRRFLREVRILASLDHPNRHSPI
jgi:serine/threonine protein kinase